ncbi:hypothetical protein D3C86_1267540 [compost metagenome]
MTPNVVLAIAAIQVVAAQPANNKIVACFRIHHVVRAIHGEGSTADNGGVVAVFALVHPPVATPYDRRLSGRRTPLIVGADALTDTQISGAEDVVVALPAMDDVAASCAADEVISRAAVDFIVAERVITPQAIDLIIATAAIYDIVEVLFDNARAECSVSGPTDCAPAVGVVEVVIRTYYGLIDLDAA